MLAGNNRVRGDVYDVALDEKMAPSLGGVVLGREHEVYVNPEEFFKRTLVTERMVEVLENILNVLMGRGGQKVLVLSAMYGGGKTHTLLTIYHALRAPHALLLAKPENEHVRVRISRFVEEAGRLGAPVAVVVVDGYFSELSPSPISPLDVRAYKVHTLWGYIAHSLGSYGALREHDEKQVAPEADRLLRVLENQKVVILADEVAHYVKRFHEAQDESLKRYSSALETFMEVLAKAVDLARNAVLVISLPAERREGGVAVEATYKAVEGVIHNLFRALARVNAGYVEPISPGNIADLLKTRLFEEVDREEAKAVAQHLSNAYRENKEIFGVQAGDPLATYPFHPLYISTLTDILDKHEGLQKTRDLLRISRKVLREVLQDRRAYALVMPWHIDLSRDSIRNVLLTGGYEGFKSVVEEDIKGRASLFEKPLLARITALALLARTFVYGGGVAPKVGAFPTESDLAQMVYEPALFQSEGWAPKDIVDAVRWIAGNLVYTMRDEGTGRLWFTRFITPVKLVEERARKVDDFQALRKVLEYAGRLLEQPVADIISGRRGRARVQARVFSPELSRALEECEPVDVDTRKYVLLACLKVPLREEERRGKLEEVLYTTRGGGLRRYANTVYVTFPSSRERVEYSLNSAKELIACEEVEREGLIEKLAGVFSGEDASLARDFFKKKLEDHKLSVLNKLVKSTLGAFDRIAYPDYDRDRQARTVREIDYSVDEDNITSAVERALSRTGVSKIRVDMDFDVLEYYLKQVGVDISGGDEERTVDSVVDLFYSNSRLPAVAEEVVKDAIKDGVKRLKIGVVAGGKLYFKRVYEKDVPQVSEGAMPLEQLSGDYKVLPWKKALLEQMKSLRRREYLEGGVRKVEEYVVRIGGKDIPVEDVLRDLDKYDLDQLRVAPIVKVVKTAAVKLEVAVREVEAQPGEARHIEVYISTIGPYAGDVVLKPSAGRVDREQLKVGEGFTRERILWTIEAPSEPGRHRCTLEARDPRGEVLDVAEAVIVVLGRERWVEGLPPAGASVEALEVAVRDRVAPLKPLTILKKLEGLATVSTAEFKASIRGGEAKTSVELKVTSVKVDDLIELLLPILSRFSTLMEASSLELSLKPRGGEFFAMPKLEEGEERELSKHSIRYLARGQAG